MPWDTLEDAEKDLDHWMSGLIQNSPGYPPALFPLPPHNASAVSDEEDLQPSFQLDVPETNPLEWLVGVSQSPHMESRPASRASSVGSQSSQISYPPQLRSNTIGKRRRRTLVKVNSQDLLHHVQEREDGRMDALGALRTSRPRRKSRRASFSATQNTPAQILEDFVKNGDGEDADTLWRRESPGVLSSAEGKDDSDGLEFNGSDDEKLFDFMAELEKLRKRNRSLEIQNINLRDRNMELVKGMRTMSAALEFEKKERDGRLRRLENALAELNAS